MPKINSGHLLLNATSAGSGKLSRFIHACMEPLPAEELIDTKFNSMLRNQRHKQWHAAYCQYAALKGLLGATDYRLERVERLFNAPISLPSRDQILKRYREALAELLLTPTVRKSDVEWKKRQLKDLKYVPVDASDVEAAIAADDAFLAAHPIKRTRRNTGEAI
jgi:hypothetical protein